MAMLTRFTYTSKCSAAGTSNTGIGLADFIINVKDTVDFFEGKAKIRCKCSGLSSGGLPPLAFYIDGIYYKLTP